MCMICWRPRGEIGVGEGYLVSLFLVCIMYKALYGDIQVL